VAGHLSPHDLSGKLDCLAHLMSVILWLNDVEQASRWARPPNTAPLLKLLFVLGSLQEFWGFDCSFNPERKRQLAIV
jgi:hypothetical protein